MSELAFINQAIANLQSAGRLAKALMGLRDQAMIDANVIELRDNVIEAQSSIFQAQAQQTSLIQRVNELEQELMRFEKWEEEKQRYQLIQPWLGCFVYALKGASKGAEPPHWICEHCYQDGRKSLIHNSQKHDRHIRYIIKCSHCQFDGEIHGETERRYA